MRSKKLLKEKQQKSMQKTLDRVLCHRVRASLLQHRSCKTAKIKKLDCDDEYGVPLNVLHRTQCTLTTRWLKTLLSEEYCRLQSQSKISEHCP